VLLPKESLVMLNLMLREKVKLLLVTIENRIAQALMFLKTELEVGTIIIQKVNTQGGGDNDRANKK